MIDAPQEALCLCFAEVTMLMSVRYRCLKLSVLWLHILFSPVMRVDRTLCGVELHTVHDPRPEIPLIEDTS